MSSLAATKQWYLLNHQKTCSLQAPSKSQCLHLSRTIPWCPFRQGTYDNRGHAKGGCRRATVVAPRSSLDDFDFGAGPIEEVRPSFTREAYKIPPPDPPKYIDNPTPKRRSRPKATPAQALAGSLIAGGCSVALFNFVRDLYFNLAMNPPVHYAPLHLEGDVNALICTFVAGFGGFAVLIFGVNSAGLALLAVKGLLSPPKDVAKTD